MSSGRPDFHPTMLLEGKYGTSLIPVLVDAAGQMYIVMTGQSIGVSGPVNVNQLAKDRDIMGSDGGTRRVIAVDANGQIVAVIKGQYLGNPATVALDANGLIKVNLTVQDLNYLKVRPIYGQALSSKQVLLAVLSGETKTVHLITGRGAVIGLYLYIHAGFDISSSIFRLYTDTLEALGMTFQEIYNYFPKNWPGPIPTLSEWVSALGYVTINMGPGITFESSIKISIYNSTANTFYLDSNLLYALVP